MMTSVELSGHLMEDQDELGYKPYLSMDDADEDYVIYHITPRRILWMGG